MEKIVEGRLDKQAIGFNADVTSKKERDLGDLFAKALPQDFVKFGLIPEFIGRVPLNVALHALDKEALVRILTEPKNALTRQYKRLFEMDHVELEFEQDALDAIAEKSLERKTGARGLRAIMENSMMDLMYHVPSDETIKKCVITRETVNGGAAVIERYESKSA